MILLIMFIVSVFVCYIINNALFQILHCQNYIVSSVIFSLPNFWHMKKIALKLRH